MSEDTKTYIPAIVCDGDLVQYREKVEKFKQGKTILKERNGCSLVPHPSGVLMAVPYTYFEYEVTQEELKAWKFQQTLIG